VRCGSRSPASKNFLTIKLDGLTQKTPLVLRCSTGPDEGNAIRRSLGSDSRGALQPDVFQHRKTTAPISKHHLWGTYAAGDPNGGEGTRFQAGSGKPREIVLRCPGPPEPWVIWLEIVFIEWSGTSFSVYERTGEAVDGGKESPGLMPPSPGRLSWRIVLEFVESYDLADLSGGVIQQIEIYGVEPWQKDVIVATMLQLSGIADFLSDLPDKELKALHARLGGFSLGEIALPTGTTCGCATKLLSGARVAGQARRTSEATGPHASCHPHGFGLGEL